MFTNTTTTEYSIFECPPISRPFLMDRTTTTTTKWKCNNIELAPNCPRCASTNTKFCYYNNYSLSQPRYFCKACRRYWTKGGSLRNVPVGGSCRKSRRVRASSRQSGGPNHADHSTLRGGPGPNSESENSGTCINLAAVFAKYVNPKNVGPGNEESFSAGSSDNCNQGSSLEIDSQLIEDVTMFDHYHQKAVPVVDLMMNRGDDNDQIQQVVPQFSVQQEIDGQDFAVYQDFNGYEMQQQGMIGDEIMGGDVLWSEEGTSLGSKVQPMMQQVQDSGLFSPDDQFRISANLVADNWGSFDPSAYEFFCNP